MARHHANWRRPLRHQPFLSRSAVATLVLWGLLAVPAVVTAWPWLTGAAEARSVIRPTGEVAAILLVAALAVSPLRQFLPTFPVMTFILRRRRWLGVAAFLYAALHMAAVAVSVGRPDWLIQGMAYASMWTGWLALALLLPLALTSNDRSVRRLGRRWKQVHRLAYPAAVLVLAHWLLLTRGPGEALAWFAPLAALQALRLWTTRRGWAKQSPDGTGQREPSGGIARERRI